MPSLWEILKASKGLPAPDGFTALFARSLSDTYTLAEISGIPPLNLGEIVEIVDYTIYGNTYQSDGASPDTPQEVVGCGDRTGNLLDMTTLVDSIHLSSNSGLPSEYYGRFGTTTPIDVSSLSSVTLSFSLDSGKTEYFMWSLFKSDGTLIERVAGKQSGYTIDVSNADKMYVAFYIGENIITTDDLQYAMLNEGSTPLPYEPYGYKLDVVSRGKNLFSWDGNLIGSSSLIVSSNKDVISSIVDVRGINTIYFTGDNTLLNSGVYRISKSDTPIEVGSVIKTYDASFFGGVYDVSDCNYLLITASVYAMPQENREIIKSTFMLNTGTTPEPYEPYIEPITTPIYLDSPLYSDDVLSYSGQKVTRGIKELILTGEEDWVYGRINEHNVFRAYLAIGAKTNNVEKCTHYIARYTNSDNSIYVASPTETGRVVIVDDRLSSIDDFKAFLAAQYTAGTPVTVYYVLAEPETKTVSPVEIPTIQGTNIIDINTEVKPSNLKITYKSKM